MIAEYRLFIAKGVLQGCPILKKGGDSQFFSYLFELTQVVELAHFGTGQFEFDVIDPQTMYMHLPGLTHKLMSFEELEQEVKGMFEPQQEEIEKKFDDWSSVMKRAAVMLSNQDTETEEGLRQIDDIEQKQVEEDKNLLECDRM